MSKSDFKMVSALIENRIFAVRGEQVMIDFHLAELYQVETKRLNEQVKRNYKRFPLSFMFQISETEWGVLQSQTATAKRRTLPYVFTEQGVSMLSVDFKVIGFSEILDNKDVCHIDASLKDLDKKWFAFSKLEADSVTILESIRS